MAAPVTPVISASTPEMPATIEAVPTTPVTAPVKPEESPNLKIIAAAEAEHGGQLPKDAARPVLEQTSQEPEGTKSVAAETQPPAATETTQPEGNITASLEQPRPKDEETRQLLVDFGKLLAKARDVRAVIVAQALAARNTPLANQFRELVLQQVSESPPNVSREQTHDVVEMQKKVTALLPATEPDFKTTPMAEFLVSQKKKGLVDQLSELPTKASMDFMNNLLEHSEGKKAEDLGIAFRQELFGDEKIPTSAQDLAAAFGAEGSAADFRWTKAKDVLSETRDTLRDKLDKKAPSGPAMFMGVMMMIQMASQFMAEAEGGARGGGGH